MRYRLVIAQKDGAVAALPLFMMWLRFGWLVILYGAQFSYSFQTIEESEQPQDNRNEEEVAVV